MAIQIEGPILDEQILDGIRKLRRPGRPDIFKELIIIFLETAPPSREKIILAMRENNLNELQAEAHFLKSGAVNLGAARLAHVCLEIEKQADNKVGLDFSSLEKIFEVEFASAISALEVILNNLET